MLTTCAFESHIILGRRWLIICLWLGHVFYYGNPYTNIRAIYTFSYVTLYPFAKSLYMILSYPIYRTPSIGLANFSFRLDKHICLTLLPKVFPLDNLLMGYMYSVFGISQQLKWLLGNWATIEHSEEMEFMSMSSLSPLKCC